MSHSRRTRITKFLRDLRVQSVFRVGRAHPTAQSHESTGLDPVYFRRPGISALPWYSTSPVTAPLASLVNVTWASTALRKNCESDSANIGNLGWAVAWRNMLPPSTVTTMLKAGVTSYSPT